MKNGAANRLAPKCRSPTLNRRGGQRWPLSVSRADEDVRSVLTLGTIKSRPPALDDASDRSAACAWLTFPVIGQKAFGEVAEFAIRRGKVAKGRAASSNCFCKHVTNGGHESSQPFDRNRTARSPGMDSGTIERLTNIDIAEASSDPLVKQEQLDRCTPAGQATLQLLCGDFKRLGTKRLERLTIV